MLLATTVATDQTSIGMSYLLLLKDAFPKIWDRFSELITAPFSTPEMLWITLPLLAALFSMELYFGRYRREQLGWNSAVGNSLVLVFVSLDLLRRLYGGAGDAHLLEVLTANIGKTILAIAVGLSGMLIFYYDFFHILPKKFAFTVSSALPVNIAAYLSIVAVYTDLQVDLYMAIAIPFFVFVLLALFTAIHRFEPKYKDHYVTKTERIMKSLFGAMEKENTKKRRRVKDPDSANKQT